jgi:hypothetical protein
MSLIKKSDLKNHLSAQNLTEIHLVHPQSQSDATGFAHEEAAGENPKVADPVENLLALPNTSRPDTAPIVAYKSAKA